MHDALEEALQVLESLRERVASNERRPSAEQICVELTHVMALIGEYAQGETRSAKVLPTPAPLAYTQQAPVSIVDPLAEELADAQEVLPDPGESYP